MSEEDFMNLAIQEAKKSEEPIKCGAVIVKNNKILTKSYNSHRADHNATAHAEIKAIAAAGKKIKNKNLEGCIIYGTCEPCIMCLSAMIFAKIEKLVYGINLKEVSPNAIDISIDEFLSRSPCRFEVIKNFMNKECQDFYET